jgi:hypothetical protein
MQLLRRAAAGETRPVPPAASYVRPSMGINSINSLRRAASVL